MTTYPDWVHKALAHAREDGQWHMHQNDAAAECFDVLAHYPDCHEARELVYTLLCDEWLIYENRRALQRLIDEWDDQPHQQRRRLALSFRYTSRIREDRFDDTPSGLPRKLRDGGEWFDEGKGQLLEAYCLGAEECVNYAWPMFQKAVEQAKDPQAVMYRIGTQYADLGFFADAAEALGELCSRYKNADADRARRLLAEVLWWRDNAWRIPWLPPAGDGSRYARMMKVMEPDAPTQAESVRLMREHLREIGKQPTWQPMLSPELAALIEASTQTDMTAPAPTLVDWSFLDGGVSALNGQPDEFERELMDDFGDDEDGEAMRLAMMKTIMRRTLIKPPKTAPRYHPDDLDDDFDPHDILNGIDDDDTEPDDDDKDR